MNKKLKDIKYKKPPETAERLLKMITRAGNSESVMGDLEEEYCETVRQKGTFRAKLFYWGHIIRSMPDFVKNYFLWSLIMFKSYLKTAYRNIVRDKGYSFINITGLAIGMAVFILIMLYVQFEISFDKYHDRSDNIYRLIQQFPYSYQGRNQAAISTGPLAKALTDEFPEVAAAARISISDDVLLSYKKNSFLENNIFFVDPDIFKIFSFKLQKGDPGTALKETFSIILSQKAADKYFGRNDGIINDGIINDPIGKTINYDGKYDFIVTGILENIPENSHFTTDFILPFQACKIINNNDFSIWYQSSVYTYCLLKDNSNPGKLESKFPAMLGKYWSDYKRKDGTPKTQYFLQALTSIHLQSDLISEIATNSNIKYIYIFSSIAFLILIIACINYMNLATARSSKRGKEVGIRKTAGAKRDQLIKQFLGESFIITAFALIISIIIISLALPSFSSFVERELSFNPAENSMFILFISGLVIFTGLFAGSYPALVISSLKPADVLKGSYKGSPKGSITRKALVILQFTISIILISGTLIVREQMDFIKNKDAGYSKDRIIVLSILDQEVRNNPETIKAGLLKNPDILSVSFSNTLPNRIRSQGRLDWPGRPKNENYFFYAGIVDYDFADLYEINITGGRKFSRDFPSDKNGAFMLNESAVKTLGWESPIGRELILSGHMGSGRGKIVGIMKDFHSSSFHQSIKPLYLYLNPERGTGYLSVKLRGTNIPETIGYIKETMKTFSPDYPFSYNFFDDLFDRIYKSEQKTGEMFSIFALIAIALACLGLFGLSSYTAEQRAGEIGIRKVLGAPVGSLVLLLVKEFTKWVLIANLIAWPAAYFAMRHWLQNFAYRTDISILLFLSAAGAALVIALLTVSIQSLKSARANPVTALKQ